LQPVLTLQELTCHMGSHTVTCHPTLIKLLPYPSQSDPGGMEGSVSQILQF